MDKVYSQSELQERLTPVFTQYSVKRAVLFGSYAKGAANEKSDIDILVDSGLRGLRFVSLCEDIRRTLGCEIDLFDVTHIDKNSRIEREIAETGVLIHARGVLCVQPQPNWGTRQQTGCRIYRQLS